MIEDPTTRTLFLEARAIGRCGQPRPHSVRSPVCRWPAGQGTDHEGYGACWRCGGTTKRDKEAWQMASEIAHELDITPWDALLAAVRISAFKVADYERRLNLMREQHGEDVDRPGNMARSLLIDSEHERRHLARVSKAAVDAGVAERLVRQVELESAVIVSVLGAALDALNLDPDQRITAHSIVHRRLLELESSEDLIEPSPD